MSHDDEPTGDVGVGTLEHAEIRNATLQGVRWFGAARLISEVSTVGAAVVLARLLPPAAFGEAALPTGIVAIATVLSAQGIATPLVQMKEVNRRDLRTAASLSVGCGLVLMLLCLALSIPLVTPIFGSTIAGLVQLSSPAWLFAGIATVPQALLERRLDFRFLSVVSVASFGVGSLTAVLLAVAGLGARAIVLGQVAVVAAMACFYVVFVRLPLPGWDRMSARRIASTGGAVSLSSLLYTAYSNVDYAILAAQLPAAQVGFYWRGYQLGVGYQGKVSRVLLQMALPLYSRTSGRRDMHRLREKITQVHAATIVPCLGFFLVVAPIAVPMVFGPRWAPAVEPARILAIAGVLAAVVTGTGPLMIAAGRARTLVWWNATELVVYALLVLATAQYGIIAVSLAAVGYSVVKTIVLQFVVRRHTGIPALQIWRDLFPAVVSTTFSMAAAEAIVRSLEGRLPALLVIGVALTFATPVYIIALRLLFPRVGSYLILMIRQFARLPGLGARFAKSASQAP